MRVRGDEERLTDHWQCYSLFRIWYPCVHTVMGLTNQNSRTLITFQNPWLCSSSAFLPPPSKTWLNCPCTTVGRWQAPDLCHSLEEFMSALWPPPIHLHTASLYVLTKAPMQIPSPCIQLTVIAGGSQKLPAASRMQPPSRIPPIPMPLLPGILGTRLSRFLVVFHVALP